MDHGGVGITRRNAVFSIRKAGNVVQGIPPEQPVHQLWKGMLRFTSQYQIDAWKGG
jgi:hypothetical protein